MCLLIQARCLLDIANGDVDRMCQENVFSFDRSLSVKLTYYQTCLAMPWSRTPVIKYVENRAPTSMIQRHDQDILYEAKGYFCI